VDLTDAEQQEAGEMVRFGYTLMTEQSRPRELVAHAAAAEQAGFKFAVMSELFPVAVERPPGGLHRHRPGAGRHRRGSRSVLRVRPAELLPALRESITA
jgi:hypothetical protein